MQTHAYGNEKIKGSVRKLPEFFPLCPTFHVVDGGGRGQVTTKQFPIYFYNKPILPDREVNIGRLAKSAQQSGGGGQLPLPRTPMHARIEFNNYFIIYLFINKI
jgi:hypothetical protein